MIARREPKVMMRWVLRREQQQSFFDLVELSRAVVVAWPETCRELRVLSYISPIRDASECLYTTVLIS